MPCLPIGCDNGESRVNAMPPAREQCQIGFRGGTICRFSQDPAAAGDNGIGRDHEGLLMARRHGRCLGGGEAKREFDRQFAGLWLLVDLGRFDDVGFEADLPQQR